MKYIFILGKSRELSLAEIKTIRPDLELVQSGSDFAVFEGSQMACQEVQNRLGGTIKIGAVIGDKLSKSVVLDQILASRGTSEGGRSNFGFSWHNTQQDRRFGMEIKKELRAQGISSRLVESKEKSLSSVIITKEKCLDFIVTPKFLALTCAVQDFKDYSQRDFGRPKSDAISGMLPPKLAKMMINLSGAKFEDTILDPSCGSGTILSEAMAMGFKNLVGSDISERAVADTMDNLNWLVDKEKIDDCKFEISKLDVAKLSEKIKPKSVNAIITEPYLGPPMKGNEGEPKIIKMIRDLESLYLASFGQFEKALVSGGRVVIVMPEWHLGSEVYGINIADKIEKMKFKRVDEGDLIYKREDQKVWRNIIIYEKT